MNGDRRKASLSPSDFIKPSVVVDEKKLAEVIREAGLKTNGNGNGLDPAMKPVDVDYVVAARNKKGVGVELRMIIPPEMAQAIDDAIWERAPNGTRKYPWRTRQDMARWCIADGLVKLAPKSQAPAKSMISMISNQKALRSRFMLLENGDEELKQIEEFSQSVESRGKNPVKHLRRFLADAESNLPEDELSLDLANIYIERLRRLIRRYES